MRTCVCNGRCSHISVTEVAGSSVSSPSLSFPLFMPSLSPRAHDLSLPPPPTDGLSLTAAHTNKTGWREWRSSCRLRSTSNTGLRRAVRWCIVNNALRSGELCCPWILAPQPSRAYPCAVVHLRLRPCVCPHAVSYVLCMRMRLGHGQSDREIIVCGYAFSMHVGDRQSPTEAL